MHPGLTPGTHTAEINIFTDLFAECHRNHRILKRVGHCNSLELVYRAKCLREKGPEGRRILLWLRWERARTPAYKEIFRSLK
uniref:Uncharacterized protein n=1 Tax=Rhinolophus ferrumequinum TaxID=59479 RepID=A0A671E467_RHIFE